MSSLNGLRRRSRVSARRHRPTSCVDRGPLAAKSPLGAPKDVPERHLAESRSRLTWPRPDLLRDEPQPSIDESARSRTEGECSTQRAFPPRSGKLRQILARGALGAEVERARPCHASIRAGTCAAVGTRARPEASSVRMERQRLPPRVIGGVAPRICGVLLAARAVNVDAPAPVREPERPVGREVALLRRLALGLVGRCRLVVVLGLAG